MYAARLAEELPSTATLTELEARDAVLAGALGRIDAIIARAMRIRIDRALAADTSIGAPTRSVIASTIAGYAGRLSPRAERRATWPYAAGWRSGRGRPGCDRCGAGGPRHPGRTACLLLALMRALPEAAVPDADRRAPDRRRDDAERRRRGAMRHELEAVVADRSVSPALR